MRIIKKIKMRIIIIIKMRIIINNKNYHRKNKLNALKKV